MPRGKFDRNKLKRVGEYAMEPATSAKVEAMISAADKEISEARVNFRWGKEQLELVKSVAEHMGIPYQTYIKQVVYRQCLQDLKTTAEAKEGSPTWWKSKQSLSKSGYRRRLLVVENDPSLSASLSNALESAEFAVNLVHSGFDALNRIESSDFDLIVLDFSLPDMSADEVCRQYRRMGGTAPILVLSAAKEREWEPMAPINVLADECIRAPFDLAQLPGRIRALLRHE
jgi:CheY-like chemotaxis protein